MKLILLLLVFLMNSCAMYKQEFDCSVPKGVPCFSETDLEAMIVETDSGPDLFFPDQKLYCKIWIFGRQTEDGYIQGHYVYRERN